MEQGQGCTYEKINRELCGLPVYDKNKSLCICHAEEKDFEEFRKFIDQFIHVKGYNFEGFIFPKGWEFETRKLHKANFLKSVFEGDANFEKVFFGDGVNFWETAFGGKANFDMAKFDEAAVFFGSRFSDNVSFGAAEFRGIASFDGSKFNKSAIFISSKFADVALFVLAEFHNTANFMEVNFGNETNFSMTEFKETAFFHNTIFKNSRFERTKFRQYSNFENCRFLGEETLFWETDFSPHAITSFNYADLKNVNFRDINFEHVTFLGSRIDKVNFMSPQFNNIRNFLNGERKNVICDELLAKTGNIKDADLQKVRRLYLDLKKNAEEMKDHQLAGDFHIGEMEMALKTEDSYLRKIFIFLYKIFSGYGEHYPLAFWWNFNLAFIIFPFLYWYLGIKISGETFSTYFNFGHSLAYSLMTWVPIPKSGIYQPGISYWSLGLTITESILGPIMITLFLLALRRRFKR